MKRPILFQLPLLAMILFSLICCPFDAIAQEIKVYGKVVDEEWEGISGVNVIVKGTTTGTITDVDGNFELSIPSYCTLTFSFITLKSIEKVINNPNVQSLDLGIIQMEPGDDGLQFGEHLTKVPLQFTKIGYNGGVNYNPVGLRFSAMTPTLFSIKTFFRTDITYRFRHNDNIYLDIELGKNRLLKVGEFELQLMGGFRKIELSRTEINQ